MNMDRNTGNTSSNSKADPPSQVIIDAFRDVQAARADRERSKNGRSLCKRCNSRARGEAEKILQEAEAYKKEVVAKAEGEAQDFCNLQWI